VVGFWCGGWCGGASEEVDDGITKKKKMTATTQGIIYTPPKKISFLSKRI